MNDNSLLVIIGTIPWLIFLIYLHNTNRSSVSETKKIKNLFWFTFVFMSLRYGVGYDYYSYKALAMGNVPDYKIIAMEILPRYLATSLGVIHYQLFFIATSFLTLYPVFWVSKKMSPIPAMSMTIFLLYPAFFLDSLSAIRNGVAYSMVLLMFYFFYEKKYIKSIIFYMVAIGFHTSIAFAILIYPFAFLFKNRKYHLLFYASSFFITTIIFAVMERVLGDSFVFQKIMFYIESEDYSGGFFYTILLNAFGLFNLYTWNKTTKYSRLNEMLVPLANVGVCAWNVFLPLSPVFATRFSSIFLYLVILLIPSYCFIFRKSKGGVQGESHDATPQRLYSRVVRKYVYSVFVSLFLFVFVLQFVNYSRKDIHMSNVPYQFFFLHSDAFAVNDELL